MFKLSDIFYKSLYQMVSVLCKDKKAAKNDILYEFSFGNMYRKCNMSNMPSFTSIYSLVLDYATYIAVQ